MFVASARRQRVCSRRQQIKGNIGNHVLLATHHSPAPELLQNVPHFDTVPSDHQLYARQDRLDERLSGGARARIGRFGRVRCEMHRGFSLIGHLALCSVALDLYRS